MIVMSLYWYCVVDICLFIIRCLNVLSGVNCEVVRKSLSVVDLTKIVETAQKTNTDNASEIVVRHVVYCVDDCIC